jgi:hypothetical protein
MKYQRDIFENIKNVLHQSKAKGEFASTKLGIASKALVALLELERQLVPEVERWTGESGILGDLAELKSYYEAIETKIKKRDLKLKELAKSSVLLSVW